AIRSVVWFMLSALVLLPVALDGVFETTWSDRRYRHVNRLLAIPAPLVCAAIVLASLAHPSSWYTRGFPTQAADVVAQAAASEPGTRIFANESYADWLVLEHPELRGKIAFDARFELLRPGELKSIVDFRSRIQCADRVTRGYSLLVLDPSSEKKVGDALLADGSRRVLYRNHVLVIRQ